MYAEGWFSRRRKPMVLSLCPDSLTRKLLLYETVCGEGNAGLSLCQNLPQ